MPNQARRLLAVMVAFALLAGGGRPAGRAVLARLAAGSTSVVISEFRTRGPNGGNDEFIELYNLSGGAVAIGGWKIRGSNSTGSVLTRLTIAAGTVLPAHGHWLATNSTTPGGYSGPTAGDQTYGTGITDDGGIALTTPDDTVIDMVGMSTGAAFKEGTTLAPRTGNLEQSYERRPGGAMGSSTRQRQ